MANTVRLQVTFFYTYKVFILVATAIYTFQCPLHILVLLFTKESVCILKFVSLRSDR
jgi:hypothetical protein